MSKWNATGHITLPATCNTNISVYTCSYTHHQYKVKTITMEQTVILYISGMFTHYKANCNTKTTVNQKHIYTDILDAKVKVFCIRGRIKVVLIND
jgi:hypothetical protein